MPNEGLTQGISRNEVKVAISRMKNGKETGMDGIPVEVWNLEVFGRRRDRHAVGSDARDIGPTSKIQYQRSGEIV